MGRACFLVLFACALLVAGCSGDKAPVEGDNPASASARQATPDEVKGRGGFNQTTNPPGTGRSGAGGDLAQEKGSQ